MEYYASYKYHMKLNQFQKFVSQPCIKMYFSKAYGLELMFVLDHAESEESDNGIDDTFDAIQFNKPRRAAFSEFINQLEMSGFLIKRLSDKKASKKVLRLSKEARQAFAEFNKSI